MHLVGVSISTMPQLRTLVLCLSMTTALTACSGSSSGGGDGVTNAGDSNQPTTDPVNPDAPDVNPGDEPTAGPPVNPNPEPPAALAPLPNPATSESPGFDDEPSNINRPVTAITRYFLVENPARRIEPQPTLGITETDFATGMPPAVITAENGFDTSTNSAPYFDGLTNQEIDAGQVLNVLYKPVDDDGGLPGMFPNELPESATFTDNFDGTKTFSWMPLQGDIGITPFTVTAVDGDVPSYRAEQTILIKVNAPADPSTIPNFPPVVNEVREHTVRVGDPVLLELKGSDRNSTYPSVEVLTPPPGATVLPHYIFEEITVLRFIPETPGVINIDVLARDADDPNLTGTRTISVTAEPKEAFALPGERLRALAGERGFRLGFAAVQEFYYRPDGALYSDLAGLEFNIVSAENSMKWDYINPEPGTFRWADADNLIAFAKHYNHIVHGHPMIWHRQLPIWIREAPEASLEMHMREFIDRLAVRYGDDVAIWDVINEPIADEGGFRRSIWYNAMGEDYIDIAFRQARDSDPDGILLLNEYDIAWDTPKTETLFPLLDSLLLKSTPIDGVGFQLHIDANFDKFDEVEANFQKVADLGLDIYVTELDVAITAGVATEEDQATVYARILDICLNQPRCKALQIWGFTDQYSWRRDQNPLVFDSAYKPKPAYFALQERLAQ